MTRLLRRVLVLATASLATSFLGCETNGWLIDPQRTGYFQTTPTSIPILDRIDVIEQARDTHVVRRKPTNEDLLPKIIEYRFSPGDVIKVTIPRLLPEQNNEREYSIGPDGSINLPLLGAVRAAGKTTTELEDEIKNGLAPVIRSATVSIQVIEARAYQYRVLGSVEAPGLYALNKPDMRLLDALATARGAAPTTTRILLTRKPRAVESKFDLDFSKPQDSAAEPAQPTAPQTGAGAPAQPATTTPPPVSTQDLDSLIGELPNQPS
ncbi:MAG: polysaccharide biosynthesis/export family protein, partial [Planctomycetota bacterium]